MAVVDVTGERQTLPQENGPRVELVVFGDEYYARYETPDGYTVVYDDNKGLFCYAIVTGGRFTSTGVPTTQPPPFGIRRHLQESEDVFRETVIRIRNAREVPPEQLALERPDTGTYGPNNGLLSGRQVSRGDVRGLTVLISFSDLTTTITRAQVRAMLNDENYTANGNFCSVNAYYKLVSGGRLNYTNDVVGPIELSRKQSYYERNLLVPEALEILKDWKDPENSNQPIDFSRYDSKDERFIDALNFMYAGPTVYMKELWPHNSYFNSSIGGYRTYFYMLTSLGNNASNLSIGTFSHENGHMICRFPDMYDYGPKNREGDSDPSKGIGQYCLMGSGNHNNSGKTPSPVCAYLRYLAGWTTEEVSLNDSGTFQANHGDYKTAMIFRTVNNNEFFLVENRTRRGLDSALNASGLAVYHCDVLGSNEFQQGRPDRHYQCALLQADGRNDLENNRNTGDGDDLFGAVSGTALSDVTNPPTRMWDGSEAGLTITDISGPGATITFRTGGGDRQPRFSVANSNPLESYRIEERERERRNRPR